LIHAEPRYRLSEARLPALAEAARAHLPHVDLRLAMEGVARGLGYASYATLRAKLSADTRRPVDGSATAAYLLQRGIDVVTFRVHHVLATFAIREVLDARYGLNQLGIELPLRPGERFRFGLREPLDAQQHAQSRCELSSPLEAPSQIRALAFASTMAAGTSFASSDRLCDYKHAAEAVIFVLSDGTILEPDYVSAGNMAAGLLYAGFAVNAQHRFKISASGFRDFKDAASIPYFFRGKWHN